MFENPRGGRQARNFTTNVPKILDLKSSSEQIFFRKLSLGAPDSCSNLGYVAPKNPVEQPKPCSQRNQKQWMTVFLPLRGVRVCYVVIRGLWFCQLKVFFRFISHLDWGAGSKKSMTKTNKQTIIWFPSYRTLWQFWILKRADLCPVLLCCQPRCDQYCPEYCSPGSNTHDRSYTCLACLWSWTRANLTGMLAVKAGTPLLSATSVLIHCPKQYWSLSCR